MKHLISRSSAPAAVLAAALAIAVPRVASAGDWHHGGACAADVQTLCPNAAGHDEVRQCLHDHKDQISSECAQKMEARHEQHVAIRNACQADLAGFCPDAQGPDIHHCLFEHRSELSDTCSQTLQSFHHQCKDKEQAPS